MRIITIIIFLNVILFSNYAQAETWGFLLGMHQYKISSSSSTNGANSTGIANSKFSLLFGVSLYNQSYPIEVDAFYSTKYISSSRTDTGLLVPVFYRADITKQLKFGIGGFAELALGAKSRTQTTDLGFAGSIQYQYPLGKAFLVLDARYLYGNTELPGKSSDINILTGIVFK